MSYTRNGLEITIEQDMDPESPREWDNVGTMICSHRSYSLGDEQFNPDDFEGWQDLRMHLKEERNAVVVLPLFLYDHSGISMYTSGDTGFRQHEAWDSGQVGFIYCTQEDVDREWDGDVTKAEEFLKGEVKTYDQYLTGDVWGYTITNPRTGGDVDSCWGFYGYKYAEEEANQIADNYEHPRESVFAKKASLIHG